MYIARVDGNRRKAVSIEVVLPVIPVMRKVVHSVKVLNALDQGCTMVGKDI